MAHFNSLHEGYFSHSTSHIYNAIITSYLKVASTQPKYALFTTHVHAVALVIQRTASHGSDPGVCQTCQLCSTGSNLHARQQGVLLRLSLAIKRPHMTLAHPQAWTDLCHVARMLLASSSSREMQR